MAKLNLQYFGGRGASSASAGSKGVNTPEENEALEWYISGEGMWINEALRGRGGVSMDDLSGEERTLLKNLDSATNKEVVKQGTLYRSVDAEAVFGQMSDLDYENLRGLVVYGDTLGKGAYADGIRQRIGNILNRTNGKTINEKGFMSTTTDASIAMDWGGFTGSSKPIVLELKTNKRTKGADLTKHRMAQSEVLVARNQKYTIDSIGTKNGQIYVKAHFE